MSKFFSSILFLVMMLLPHTLAARDNDLKASAVISVNQDQEIWSGQQVTLNLDLKTTGLSFSNTHFNLPEVDGAFLMQTDSTTIKLTEKIDGQDWQIVRYPLALYPLKSGRLEVPAIDVRFSTSIGFGGTGKAFEFQTEKLDLGISLPPGVNQEELVVTTTSFELDHIWQPDSATASSGDAFTLTVSRRAHDISAMLLPPLPVFRTSGLAAYPQAPEVNDKTDRGDLTGERIDKIIWVAEKPGVYEIPGIRFQWWDPDSQKLQQQIVPGLSLDILPSAADSSVTATTGEPAENSGNLVFLLMFMTGVILVGAMARSFRKNRRVSQLVDEKSAFNGVKKACKSNQPGDAHNAIHSWLRHLSPEFMANSRPVTLTGFASLFKDQQLTTDLQQLQDALVLSNKDWCGLSLLSSLQRTRDKISNRKTAQSKTYLAPLNPWRARTGVTTRPELSVFRTIKNGYRK